MSEKKKRGRPPKPKREGEGVGEGEGEGEGEGKPTRRPLYVPPQISAKIYYLAQANGMSVPEYLREIKFFAAIVARFDELLENESREFLTEADPVKKPQPPLDLN